MAASRDDGAKQVSAPQVEDEEKMLDWSFTLLPHNNNQQGNNRVFACV